MPDQYRTYFLVFGLIVFLAWESLHPFVDLFRGSTVARGGHLVRNSVVALLNATMVSTVFVALWAIAAGFAESRQLGLLNQFSLAGAFRVAAAIVLLDGWTYAWHWMNHRIPWLWRFHRMHHSDSQMDVTTASRFHFGEIAASSLLRVPLIVLLGVRLPELVLYEAMMFAVVQFHHANIGLPGWLDRVLRVFIVTPAMHKVHHSREVAETNSNYTSFLSFWDRLFGTFRIRENPYEIRFGLEEFDDNRDQSLVGLMKTPLRQLRSSSRSHLLYVGLLGVAIAAGAVFVAVGRNDNLTWPEVQRLIARKFPDVRNISTGELDEWLADSSRKPPTLLDVREVEEFEVSHLPGASRLSPSASDGQLPAELPEDTPIVVYCSVGYRSAEIAQRLQGAGFSNVRNLEGSIFRWANENRRLVRNEKDVFVVHPYDKKWGSLVDSRFHSDPGR